MAGSEVLRNIDIDGIADEINVDFEERRYVEQIQRIFEEKLISKLYQGVIAGSEDKLLPHKKAERFRNSFADVKKRALRTATEPSSCWLWGNTTLLSLSKRAQQSLVIHLQNCSEPSDHKRAVDKAEVTRLAAEITTPQ